MTGNTSKMRTAKRVLPSILAAIALIAAACGGGTNVAANEQASVNVDSIESGCTEAIDLSLLLSGSDPASLSTADIEAGAAGAGSLDAAFPDRPNEVGDYFSLVADVFGNAATSASEQGSLSGEQVQLLLDFELAGRRADFDRLSPAADEFFAARCGASYTDATSAVPVPADGSDTTDVIAADTTVAPEPDTTDKADTNEAAEAPVETTTSAPPLEPGSIEVSTESMGALGLFGGGELTVGEIWRTNVSPVSAVTGVSEVSEDGAQPIVMIGIRLTSTSWRMNNRPENFGLVSPEGFRTNATSAILESGEPWDLDLVENESVAGFLVFEGDFGDVEANTLQWIDEGAPANVLLGDGATVPNYPAPLPATEAPISSTVIGSTFGCEFSYSGNLRGIEADLENFGSFNVTRAGTSDRFIRYTLSVGLDSVEGEGTGCRISSSILLTNLELRLLLPNGDARATVADSGGTLELASTREVNLLYEVPADITSFDLVDSSGTVIVSLTDIELPEL